MNSFLPSVASTPLDHQRDFNTKGGEGEGSLLATYLHACPLPAGILGTSRKWEALALICWFLKRNTLLSRHPQDALDFTHFIRDLDSPPLWNGPTDPGAPTVLPTPPHTPLAHPTFQLCFSVYSLWRVIFLSRVGTDVESKRPSPSPGGLCSTKPRSPLPASAASHSRAPPPRNTTVQWCSNVMCVQTLLGIRCKETTVQQKTFNQKVVLSESCSPSVS